MLSSLGYCLDRSPCRLLLTISVVLTITCPIMSASLALHDSLRSFYRPWYFVFLIFSALLISESFRSATSTIGPSVSAYLNDYIWLDGSILNVSCCWYFFVIEELSFTHDVVIFTGLLVEIMANPVMSFSIPSICEIKNCILIQRG